MKQDYTLDELQAEMTALAQLFDSVTLADPRMGLLDPATLQPLNKVAAMPALDAAGRGLKIEKAADGLRTVIAQGITVADTPCVLLLGMPLPRNLQADGAEDAFTRALSQMQDDLRRDYVTGVYNSVYLNEAFRPRAERAALDGKPVGVVMVRVNEYWQLREQESDSAANCCLNMASGILQLVVGPDHDKAVLARLNDGRPDGPGRARGDECLPPGVQHLAVPPRQLYRGHRLRRVGRDGLLGYDALSGTAAPVNRIKHPPCVHTGIDRQTYTRGILLCRAIMKKCCRRSCRTPRWARTRWMS